MPRTWWRKDQKGQDADIFPFPVVADTGGSLRLVRKKGEPKASATFPGFIRQKGGWRISFSSLCGVVASALPVHAQGCGNPGDASYQGPDVPKGMAQSSTSPPPLQPQKKAEGETWSQPKKRDTQVVG